MTIVADTLPPGPHDPLRPMAQPVLVNEDGYGWIPHAFDLRIISYQPICDGMGLAWAPVPEVGKILLCIAGGNPAVPTDENVAAFISRGGLREIIADLQSIDVQLGDCL